MNHSLLFVTQTMDRNDTVLGAYHAWVARLAPSFEKVTVICLFEGEHDLPENVSVHSLGKEKGAKPGFVYALRFLSLAWKLRSQYDRVFVHMNQEYLLIAGPLWLMLDKQMYLWRNHYAGSFLTDVAAGFCTKVFCTSKHSYTAKFRQTVFMPVGVDLTRFSPEGSAQREPRSILFLARISPSKRADIFIDALKILIDRGVSFIADIYGSPTRQDERYYETLKQHVEEAGLHGRVRFHAAVPNRETPSVYRAHEIFVNCSRSGMFDKTIFEAAACGDMVLAASEDLEELMGEEYVFDGTAKDLARMLETVISEPETDRRASQDRLAGWVAREHSLDVLASRLSAELL